MVSGVVAETVPLNVVCAAVVLPIIKSASVSKTCPMADFTVTLDKARVVIEFTADKSANTTVVPPTTRSAVVSKTTPLADLTITADTPELVSAVASVPVACGVVVDATPESVACRAVVPPITRSAAVSNTCPKAD